MLGIAECQVLEVTLSFFIWAYDNMRTFYSCYYSGFDTHVQVIFTLLSNKTRAVAISLFLSTSRVLKIFVFVLLMSTNRKNTGSKWGISRTRIHKTHY